MSKAGCIAIATGIILLLASLAFAEAPHPIGWPQQIGTAQDDSGHSVAVDAGSNVYLSGATDGYLAETGGGFGDAFVAKYDQAGNRIWIHQLGTREKDYSKSIAVDAWGNAFIGGATYGYIGPGTRGSSYDAFVAKYDAAGNFAWARQAGAGGWDICECVTADPFGNVYVTGYTEGSLFTPSLGNTDAFLAKYDPAGNILWSRQFGSSSGDWAYCAAGDRSGNVYVTGTTNGNLGGTNPNPMWSDAFLVKYDSNGDQKWARQIATTSTDQGYGVATDASGNAYVTGYTGGSLGGTNPQPGSADPFLIKYDADGNLVWARELGTSINDYGRSVVVDVNGNILVAGHTSDSDALLFKYDSEGNLLWSQILGTPAYDEAYGVAVDGWGRAYVSGRTYGSLAGANIGGQDAFLIQFIPEPAALSLLALGGVAMIRRKRK